MNQPVPRRVSVPFSLAAPFASGIAEAQRAMQTRPPLVLDILQARLSESEGRVLGGAAMGATPHLRERPQQRIRAETCIRNARAKKVEPRDSHREVRVCIKQEEEADAEGDTALQAADSAGFF
jgi:hypothetical protein